MIQQELPFVRVCDDFKIDFDLSRLDNIPEVVHVYGAGVAPKIPDTLCWMTYAEALDVTKFGQDKPGTISFTRHTSQFLPDLAMQVCNKLRSRFKDIHWLPARVHVIRTQGYIPPHIDENRRCALNIGLKNSAIASTLFSVNNCEDDFLVQSPNTVSFSMQDNVVYLLDVSKFHSVIPASSEPRFLVTYGFGAEFYLLRRYLSKPLVTQ